MPGTTFVGRERELQEIRARLEMGRLGKGSVFLIGGEAGIGKTRLVNEIADSVTATGVRLFWGRCWEGAGAPSLWPWLQILRTLSDATSDQDLGKWLGRGAGEIADLVPEIRQRLHDGIDSPPLPPDQARFRLLDSVASFLTRAAEAAPPLVLILDDIHCADELSLQLMQFIARSARLSPLLMLGTYRITEARQSPGTAPALEAIAREATVFTLTGLNVTQVRHYLRATLTAPPSSTLVSTVHARTEGNPLFLGEIARILQSNPARSGGDFDLPQEVYAAISRRLEPLSPATHRCLRLASVIGREIDAGLLGALISSDDPVDVEACLVEAVSADVLWKVSTRRNRFRFAHELIRESLYHSIPESERGALHRRIADQLEAAGSLDPDEYYPALAYHFCAAADGGRETKAIEYAILAAQHASRRHVHEDAVRHYRAALSVLGESPETESQRIEILMACGHAQWLAGQPENGRETFARIADRLRPRLGDPSHPHAAQLFAEAAFGYGGPGLGQTSGATDATNQQLLQLLEEALAAVGAEDSPVRARLLGRHALAMSVSGDAEQRLALSREAIAVARRLGDHATLAFTLLQSHWGGWVPGNVHERLANAAELIALADELGDAQIALAARSFRIYDLIAIGDLATASSEITTHAAMAEQLRHPFHLYCALRIRTMLALMAGQLSEAESLVEQTLAAGERVDGWISLTTQVGQKTILAFLCGRPQEVEELLKDCLSRYPGLPALRNLLARVYSHSGRHQAARHLLDLLAADDFALVPLGFTWPLAMAALAEVCVELRDNTHAAALYEKLKPHAQSLVMAGAAGLYGTTARFLAPLAAQLERPDEAVDHFERALLLEARVGSRPTLALTQYAYAQFLADGSPAQQQRAWALVEAALESAREMGMEGLADDALALQQRLAGKPHLSQAEASAQNVFRKLGAGWSIAFAGRSVEVKDRKGLRYLAELLRQPGRDHHVADLVSVGAGAGAEAIPMMAADAGILPDREARESYRARIGELRSELEELERNNDHGRVAHIRSEIDALSEQLAQSYGLGSRQRAADDTVEKMRKAVLAATRNALREIEAAHADLGSHLRHSVTTGVLCTYRPEQPVTWLVSID